MPSGHILLLLLLLPLLFATEIAPHFSLDLNQNANRNFIARYTDGANEFSPWPEGLGNLVKLRRAGDRALQLLLFNEECLVSASHQLALITSLPFGFLTVSVCYKLKDKDRIYTKLSTRETYLYEGLKENFSPVDNISAISSVCIEIDHFRFIYLHLISGSMVLKLVHRLPEDRLTLKE